MSAVAAKLNPASWLSVTRLFMLPLAALPLAANWDCGVLIAAAVSAAAGLTDFFDGYLARKSGLVTRLGANLDRGSDKVVVN